MISGRVAVAAFLFAFFALVVGSAFAASLSLVAEGRPAFTKSARCSPEQVDVELDGASASVQVPEPCLDTALDVLVADQDGVITAPASGTAGTAQLPRVPDDPKAVLVTADSWPLRTHWSAAPQPPVGDDIFTCKIPNGACWVEVTKIHSWSGSWPTIDHYQVTASVMSDAPSPEPWEVTINLSSPELPFLAAGLEDVQTSGLVKVSATDCSASPRTVTVKGTTSWGEYHLVGGGMPARNMQVEGRLTGDGNLLSCPAG